MAQVKEKLDRLARVGGTAFQQFKSWHLGPGLSQDLTKASRQIRHAIQITCLVNMKPLKQLVTAVGGFTQICRDLAQLVGEQTLQVVQGNGHGNRRGW